MGFVVLWSSEDFISFAYIDKPKLVRSRVLPESLLCTVHYQVSMM